MGPKGPMGPMGPTSLTNLGFCIFCILPPADFFSECVRADKHLKSHGHIYIYIYIYKYGRPTDSPEKHTPITNPINSLWNCYCFPPLKRCMCVKQPHRIGRRQTEQQTSNSNPTGIFWWLCLLSHSKGPQKPTKVKKSGPFRRANKQSHQNTYPRRGKNEKLAPQHP